MSCLFFKNHFRYTIYQATSNVCFNSQKRQIETSIQALGIAKRDNIYLAAILDAILNISKCSMMTR